MGFRGLIFRLCFFWCLILLFLNLFACGLGETLLVNGIHKFHVLYHGFADFGCFFSGAEGDLGACEIQGGEEILQKNGAESDFFRLTWHLGDTRNADFAK